MKQILSILFVFSLISDGFAQIGGRSAYEFLNLPGSARVASLGGKMLAAYDGDLTLAFFNPALLNREMDRQLTLNFVSYFADIRFGSVAYARHIDDRGTLSAGINFIHYGKFTAADETGEITGHFRASDYTLNLSWAMPIDSSFHAGICIKPVFSAYERYTSLGLAADVGVCYNHPGKNFTAALVARNIGMQIIAYNRGTQEPIPFEIMLGASHKLEHAPFRFYLLLHHLERWKLTYTLSDDAQEPLTPAYQTDTSGSLESFAENILRHVVAGVEIIPLDNLFFRIGYNYQRRRELQVSSRTGTVGFSWGFGVKISRFSISYGRATYHLAGASNHFSVATNLSAFSRALIH